MSQLTPLQAQQLIAERDKLSEENARMRALLQQHNLSIPENAEDDPTNGFYCQLLRKNAHE
jgi:hypothetical protein